jgi:fructose-1,6-bisphosphatase-3
MRDMNFPTIEPWKPFELTEYEEDVLDKLEKAFLNSDLLQKHAKYLFAKGSFYKIHNNNLLFHGCIPLDEKGDFAQITHNGKTYRGRKLMDFFEKEAGNISFPEIKEKIPLEQI